MEEIKKNDSKSDKLTESDKKLLVENGKYRNVDITFENGNVVFHSPNSSEKSELTESEVKLIIEMFS